MITSTTPEVAERSISQTLGVVSGEAIIGAHLFRDLFAGTAEATASVTAMSVIVVLSSRVRR